MRSNKHRFGNICISVGMVLIFGAIGLGMWNLKENYRAGMDSERILQELAPIITQNGTAPVHSEETEELVDLTDYEMPVKEINGGRYIGVLVVPDLELEVPIQDGWDSGKLQVSPCRYSGEAITRNLVICAHNYSTHFGRLKELNKGADVHLVTMKGNVLNYKVELVETLMPTDVAAMKESPYDLTLFTCTIGGATRVTVRCQSV